MHTREKHINKWQKTGVYLFAFIFLVSIFGLGSPAPAYGLDYPFTGTINTQNKVNMRRSASSGSTILEYIENGDEFTVLGEKGRYYHVSFNNRTGYVEKKYVNTGEAQPTAAPTAAPTNNNNSNNNGNTVSGYPYTTTAIKNVNLRKRASTSTSSTILARIDEGDELTVTGMSGEFAKVIYNGKDGYVMSEFINIKNIEGGATNTASPGSPTNKPSEDYILLQKGTTGAEVTALQWALTELGFLSGAIDGNYGSGTQSAIQALQKKNNLEQTGAADASLQTLIFEGKPLNSDGKATEVKSLPALDDIIIRSGNMGAAVERMQEKLKQLGYDCGEINGIHHSESMAAVKAFQKKNGLTQDGIAGGNTLNKLYSANALGPDDQATATPAPIPSAPVGTIRKGDEGPACKTVQERLIILGYLNSKADGIFGPASDQALKAFQKANGLNDDGVAGSQTMDILFSNNAISASDAATYAPAPTETPLTPDNVIIVQSGTKGEIVRKIQKRLTELGYYTARNDTNYLADDIAAVRAFQKANGLKVDGKAGYDTQVLMFSDRAIGPNAQATDQPTATMTPMPNLVTLRQGDTGTAVRTMQEALIKLGYLSSKADGSFGLVTAEAVVAFQRNNGLYKDGIAGINTLTLLYSGEAKGEISASPTPGPGEIVIKQGDINDNVKSMQERLIKLGYLTGRADGNFGLQTYMALKAFQIQNGLVSDGVAGEKTLAMINSDNAKPAPTVAGATPTPKPSAPDVGKAPKASEVRYANWYSETRARARLYPYATVYDFETGISWKVHMFSLGAHADSEPLTKEDTAQMMQAFGGKETWTPKAVWVIMSDGRVYLASTHSVPHEVQHIKDNNFQGHLCIHFPRSEAQVSAIGPYATSHQKAIDAGWAKTQSMIK